MGSKAIQWLMEIEIEKYISEDAKIILEEIGKEKFMRLLSTMRGVTLYFSEQPLMQAKREFIVTHRSEYTIDEFINILDVSKTFVYESFHKKKENSQDDTEKNCG